MKKIIPVLLCLLLFSCTNVLDKKIDKDHFADDLKVLKEKYSDTYSNEDFEQLTAGIGLSSVIAGDKMTGTYREILDNIKGARIKREADSIKKMHDYQIKLDAYNKQEAVLLKVISLTVTNKEAVSLDDLNLQQGIKVYYTVTNNGAIPLTAYAGGIYIYDMSGKFLSVLPVQNHYIDAGKSESLNIVSGINDLDGDEAAIKGTDFGKLKFEWQPGEIIFKDGRPNLEGYDRPKKPEF